MSLRLNMFNRWLKWVEKPAIRRATDPAALRAEFARQTRLFRYGPRNIRSKNEDLIGPEGPVSVRWVNPRHDQSQPLIFYIHGGAFIVGSPETHRGMMATLCQKSGLSACLPRYRLAPDHAFPAALDDVIAAYQAISSHRGGVIIGGDSAGGCLAFILLAEISKNGWQKPIGCFTFSTLTDMTFSGQSVQKNAEVDVLLPAERAHEMHELYLQGTNPTDPKVSPIFAEFPDCCPVWMAVGSTEILLDDSKRMAEKLRQGGTDVTLVIKENHFHVWPFAHRFLPEASQTLADVAAWFQTLPGYSSGN